MRDDNGKPIITHGGPYVIGGEEFWIYPFGDHLNGYDFQLLRSWSDPNSGVELKYPRRHASAEDAAQHYVEELMMQDANDEKPVASRLDAYLGEICQVSELTDARLIPAHSVLARILLRAMQIADAVSDDDVGPAEIIVTERLRDNLNGWPGLRILYDDLTKDE